MTTLHQELVQAEQLLESRIGVRALRQELAEELDEERRIRRDEDLRCDANEARAKLDNYVIRGEGGKW